MLFFFPAGLKSLIDSQFHNPIKPVFVGYLQKGLKKYKGLPLVHRPGTIIIKMLHNNFSDFYVKAMLDVSQISYFLFTEYF